MKNLKYLFILIIIFFLFVINLNSKKITYNYVLEPRCIYNIEKAQNNSIFWAIIFNII